MKLRINDNVVLRNGGRYKITSIQGDRVRMDKRNNRKESLALRYDYQYTYSKDKQYDIVAKEGYVYIVKSVLNNEYFVCRTYSGMRRRMIEDEYKQTMDMLGKEAYYNKKTGFVRTVAKVLFYE